MSGRHRRKEIDDFLSRLSQQVLSYSDTNCLQWFLGIMGQKSITIHIVPKRTIAQKIVVHPWRKVICNDSDCLNYTSETFINSLLNLLDKDVTVDTILSMHITTNIKPLGKKLLERKLSSCSSISSTSTYSIVKLSLRQYFP